MILSNRWALSTRWVVSMRWATRLALFLSLAIVGLTSGCRFSLGRVRDGRPLDTKTYADLEPGTSRLDEAVERLGAPDRVSPESGRSRLSWEYVDTTLFETRIQSPISLFGYRHTFLDYFQNRDAAHRMDLVFDEDGLLAEKSLRIPDAYKDGASDRGSERYSIGAELEHSFLLLGDAGIADYDDFFEPGPAAAIAFGIQPVAPVLLSLAGRATELQGRDFAPSSGARIRVDDLEMYSAEIRLRIQIPLRIFASIESLRNLWRLFLEADPSAQSGWLLFTEGSIGVAWNDHVPVARGGSSQGTVFDAGIGMTNSGVFGVEYAGQHFFSRLGLVYRTTDGFDRGSASFAREGGGFQSLGALISVAFAF
jgi:hypothetical protein